jgi:DUF1365 family protein
VYKHSLCQGVVWHKRYHPKIHQFKYRLNSWLIDLQDIETLNIGSCLLNSKKLSLYRFNQNNYFSNYEGNILTRLKKVFIDLGAILSGTESFYLLGQISNLGVYFSPLNLYLCYSNTLCTYILAEVANTPWNERHYYLLNMHNPPHITKKNFHVSPFWGLNQQYHWKFRLSSNKLFFRIDTYQDQKLVFSAGYVGFINLLSCNKTSLKLLRAPFTIYKILIAIYFEALRIWLKKIPFVAHPNRSRKL